MDLYLVTSRAEGGPKAILESMASGVPLISTKVGMASDIIFDGVNGSLCDIADISNLYQKAINIIEDNDFRNQIINNGLSTAMDYSWEKIAQLYYEKLYKSP